jgi:hypothetical protein
MPRTKKQEVVEETLTVGYLKYQLEIKREWLTLK